jgi:hypothetical protein
VKLHETAQASTHVFVRSSAMIVRPGPLPFGHSILIEGGRITIQLEEGGLARLAQAIEAQRVVEALRGHGFTIPQPGDPPGANENRSLG